MLVYHVWLVHIQLDDYQLKIVNVHFELLFVEVQIVFDEEAIRKEKSKNLVKKRK
jgi:hypothetical protein